MSSPRVQAAPSTTTEIGRADPRDRGFTEEALAAMKSKMSGMAIQREWDAIKGIVEPTCRRCADPDVDRYTNITPYEGAGIVVAGENFNASHISLPKEDAAAKYVAMQAPPAADATVHESVINTKERGGRVLERTRRDFLRWKE